MDLDESQGSHVQLVIPEVHTGIYPASMGDEDASLSD
jgi:hypothetical protein